MHHEIRVTCNSASGADNQECHKDLARNLPIVLVRQAAEANKSSSYESSRDPLCLSNASLAALQNLRPWAAEEQAAAAAMAEFQVENMI